MPEQPPVLTNIEGWMTEGELQWLCQTAKDKHVLEIGTFLGRSTINMLLHCKSMVSIDHFKGNPHDVASDVVREIERHGSTLWQQFLHRLAEHNIGDRQFILMKMCSKRAYQFLSGQRFGFIFIDGNHEYNDVISDIALYKGLVSKGGVLAGHDYYLDGNFPGVRQAVDEQIGRPDEVVETIWVKKM
jgi:predicted O-methyltransferase YrrM